MNKDRNQKKILQITMANFPTSSAIRVVKEGLSLREAGYQCAVLCPPFGDKLVHNTWNDIEIFKPKILERRSIWDKLLAESLFISPNWLCAIREIIDCYQPDALHVHDIWFGRMVFQVRVGQKIVMDLHENMPAAVVEHPKNHRGVHRWFLQLFHNRQRILTYERDLLSRCDLVLTVVDEARVRVLTEHPQLNTRKVITVTNYESKRFVAETGVGRPAFNKDHFSVLYIGGFSSHRGIDTLIHALAHIKQTDRNIKLHLIGAHAGQYLETLKGLIAKLELKNLVQIVDWVTGEDVLANIKQADLCCVPHHSNPHTDNTIPHKLFQYMIAKRPVLVSSSAPLARTVRQSEAGSIFESGDPVDCARKIIELADDPDRCARCAENGNRYVMGLGHNWEEASAPNLIAAYDKMLLGYD